MLVAARPSAEKHVGRPPGRRRGAQRDPRLSPTFGRGDDRVGLAGARLADHDRDSLTATEQPANHLGLIGLQGRPSGDHALGNRLAGDRALGAAHALGRGERLLLQLPDPLRGEAIALRPLADPHHVIGGEVGIGGLFDLFGFPSLWEQIRDRLHDVAAVEVGDARRDRAVHLLGG